MNTLTTRPRVKRIYEYNRVFRVLIKCRGRDGRSERECGPEFDFFVAF